MSRKNRVNVSHQIVSLIILFSFGLGLLQACGPDPTQAPSPTPRPTDSSTKIDSLLLEVLLRYNTTEGSAADKQKAAVDFARERGLINPKNEVQFEMELDDPSRAGVVSDKVKGMGGRIIDSPNIEGVVKLRVAVPVNTFISYANAATKDNFLRDLADFQGVKNIQIIVPSQLQEMSRLPETREALLRLYQASQNQGVKQMGADKWQNAGLKGKGAKVGVIDGGFKYYQEFLGTILPANLQIRDQDKEIGGEGAIDETVHGTAVLEILYSLAPEAEFYAVAVDRSDNEIASALDYLVSKGVHIISMSLGGHGASGEGSEPLNRKIDGLRQKGILFFISAGNEGDSHYAGTFNPDAQGFHQWVPGLTRMAFGNFTGVPFNTSIILNWEQWKERTNRTDLDLYIEDANGKPVVSSTNYQTSREPREYVPLKVQSRTTYYLKVRLKPNTPQPAKPFRLHIFANDVLVQFYTPVLAVANPADSKGAFAVGAVQWDSDKITDYSSQGPLPNGVFKPELSAPAGVSSAAYAEESVPEFDGTSASCPEAAGLAALIKGANPKLSADELSQVILQSVRDLGTGGPDTAYGYGRPDLTNVPPGEIKPKSQLPTLPAADPNPPLNLKISKRFPAPAGVALPPEATAPPPPTRTQAPAQATQGQATLPPEPTADPEPVSGPVVFSDDFQSALTGLPDGGATTYENGLYRIKANANQLVWATYPELVRISDFAAEVKVQGLNANNGLYGLVFWLQSPTDYYLLSVSGAGLMQVSRFNAGRWQELISWSAAPGWNSGGANTLRLVSGEGRLSVGVNNKTTKSVQAKGTGGIGFAAGGYAQPANVTFSNFKLSTRS